MLSGMRKIVLIRFYPIYKKLHNRAMHISGKFDLCSKADIGNKKADIRKRLKTISTDVSEKTIRHVIV